MAVPAARASPQRRHRAPRSDAGNAVLIEAMVLALLVLSAIEFASLMQAPGTLNPTPRRELALDVRGALQNMLDTRDAAYPSLLERAVAESLQGNNTVLEDKLERALPPGVAWNAWLDNGQGQLRLRWVHDAQGEAVSADRLLVPSWGPVLGLPLVQLVDATRSGLVAQAVPLHRSAGLGGLPGLQAEVELQLPDGSHINVTAAAPLVNRTSAQPGVSLGLLDAGARTLIARPASGNQSLFVAVEETQGRAVAAGTELRVSLPPGFTSVQADAAVNPDWTGLAVDGNSTYGWTVRGSLAAPLSGAVRQFELNATPPAGKVFLVEGAFDGGKLGRFAAAYLAPSGSTTSASLPPGRGPWLTLPSKAPYGALARAGLVLAAPDDASRTLTAVRMTLTPYAGAVLLDGAGLAPSSGWALTTAKLEWTGSRSLASDDALEWGFNVRASAPARDASVPDALRWDARNGLTGNASGEGAPGVWRGVLGPDGGSAKGFSSSAGDHDVAFNATDLRDELAGTVAFNVSAISVIQASASDAARGAWESWLQRDNATVAPGGRVTFTWNVTRVVDELGVQVTQFKCYTSTSGASTTTADEASCTSGSGLAWQFRHEAPSVSLRVYHPSPAAAGAPALEGQLTGLAAQGSGAYDVPASSLLGTHVAELRAEFRLHDTGSGTATQRVSLLATYDVAPDGSVLDASPGYVLLVQAWMPEWG